jgi:hypothetical protein
VLGGAQTDRVTTTLPTPILVTTTVPPVLTDAAILTLGGLAESRTG